LLHETERQASGLLNQNLHAMARLETRLLQPLSGDSDSGDDFAARKIPDGFNL
jgi:hypothetical protein